MPGLPGYKVPVGAGWYGGGGEIGGSPDASSASGDLGLAAVEAGMVAVLAGPADGTQ